MDDRLIDGLSGVADQLSPRTVLGEPFDDAYGNDRYALEDGAEMIMSFRKGPLTHVVLRDNGAADRRKLLRTLEVRATRAAGSCPQRLDVHDEDGILAIVNPAAYQGFVGD